MSRIHDPASPRRLSLPTRLAAAVAATAIAAIGFAAPVNALDEQPPLDVVDDAPEVCTAPEAYTEHEYQRMIDPGQEEVVQTLYRFDQWGTERIWIGHFPIDVPVIVATAWFPLPDTFGAAFWAAVALYEDGGWVFNGLGGTQTNVIPGTDPTYETVWSETPPEGDGWEATGNTQELSRDVPVLCPQPEPIVEIEVSEQSDCVTEVVTITTTTTTTEFVVGDDPLTWVPGEPVVEVTVDTEPYIGSPCPDAHTPGDDDPEPDPTPQPDPDPDLDPTPPTDPQPEVGGIDEDADPIDEGVAGSGGSVAPAPTTLPRTGLASGAMVLIAAIALGLGATLRTVSTRLR